MRNPAQGMPAAGSVVGAGVDVASGWEIGYVTGGWEIGYVTGGWEIGYVTGGWEIG